MALLFMFLLSVTCAVAVMVSSSVRASTNADYGAYRAILADKGRRPPGMLRIPPRIGSRGVLRALAVRSGKPGSGFNPDIFDRRPPDQRGPTKVQAIIAPPEACCDSCAKGEPCESSSHSEGASCSTGGCNSGVWIPPVGDMGGSYGVW